MIIPGPPSQIVIFSCACCIKVSKDITEKPCNGKTVKNDRRNYCYQLILDTWQNENDWENTHIFVMILISFWDGWKWKIINHKNAKFSKLRDFEMVMGQFFDYMK